jgi:katanin p60 ATPase-containing subunit A1
MRRRLEKRIYIPLPNYEARVALLEMLLKDIAVDPDVSITKLAEISDGYSGSDLHVACRDAAMMPMRRLLETFPPEILMAMQNNGNLELPDLTMNDFYQAFTNTRPSVSAQSLSKYVAWEDEFSNK